MPKMEDEDRKIIREIARMLDEAADEALQVADSQGDFGKKANPADARETAALAYAAGFFKAGAILATTFAKKWKDQG